MIEQTLHKAEATEIAQLGVAKGLELERARIDGLRLLVATKDETEARFVEVNKGLREAEKTLNELQNSMTTLGNYAEKYIPFHFQKAIHDSFLYITRDQYKMKLESYFPRIYRAIHHKILNSGGKPALDQDISELNKMFGEIRYENIGVPISPGRFDRRPEADPEKEPVEQKESAAAAPEDAEKVQVCLKGGSAELYWI